MKPRFTPGTRRASFVNREDIIDEFKRCLAGDHDRRILNLVGVGGIGKSRLLAELASIAADTHVQASLDLHIAGHQAPSEALAALRTGFGQSTAKFDRFDIAYAVLWQRLHPMQDLSTAPSAVLQSGLSVASVVEELTLGVPVVGTANSLLRLAGRNAKKWHHIRNDQTLRDLDQMNVQEVIDACTFLLADDLHKSQASAVLTIDSYDTLGRSNRSGWEVEWLRELVLQLSNSIVVIAGREPLDWQRSNPAWNDEIKVIEVGPLPAGDCRQLLAELGHDERAIGKLVSSSSGLPFYLELLDVTQGTTSSSNQAVVDRFLRDVDPTVGTLLEPLALCRRFTRPLALLVAEELGLPSGNYQWQRLQRYAFVRTLDDDSHALHDLMAAALTDRQDDDDKERNQQLLSKAWSDLTGAEDAGENADEALYHGLLSGEVDGEAALHLIDKMRLSGGVHGIRSALRTASSVAASAPATDVDELIRCLEAESDILLGNTGRLVELFDAEPLSEIGNSLDVRYLMSQAHGLRISGRTTDAAVLYDRVRHGAAGGDRFQATLWIADLDMAQGRFEAALQLAASIVDDPSADSKTKGDAYRLSHLSHRFAFDFEASQQSLTQAVREYSQAESVQDMTNVRVNQIELSAITDPAEAVRLAPEAIEAQTRHGALPEVGKCWTAVALANLALNDLSGADGALKSAFEALEACGYASGVARAELVSAFLEARNERLQVARNSVRAAVSGLIQAEVYPTLIVLGCRLLERLGVPDPEIWAATQEVLAKLSLPMPTRTFEDRVSKLIDVVLADEFSSLITEAGFGAGSSSGFYNQNVQVGDYLARRPIQDADSMDIRIWPEPYVVAPAAMHLDLGPRLIAYSESHRSQLHVFVEGQVLDVIAPKGEPLPDGVPEQLVQMMAKLTEMPRYALPALPDDWPADGNSAAFGRYLQQHTQGIIDRFAPEYGQLWAELGLPLDALALLDWSSQSDRPFTFVHTDIHRKNIIVRPTGECVLLDWEMALWGDPLYELVVHLHKMAYLPEEEELVVSRWASIASSAQADRWQEDLVTHRNQQRLKSAFVDSVRYTKLYQDADEAGQQDLGRRLKVKLAGALGVLELETDVDVAYLRQVMMQHQ